MSAERDELAEALAVSDGWPPEAFRVREYVRSQYRKYYDAVIAAGYRKPRTVTTAAELDALPVGSVVLDDEGDPWHKQEDHDGSGAIWRVPGSLLLESIDLVGCYPTLTVLHVGAQP